MSTRQVEETLKVEIPFPLSLFMKAKFLELSSALAGCADMSQTAHSGEGLPQDKLLAKPKSRMDLYRVSKSAYHLTPAVLDGPLMDHDVCELEMVSILTSFCQRLEEDARVLTLISSFLDCTGFSANSLLDEACKGFRVHEATRGGPLGPLEVLRESDWAPALWSHYIGCESEVDAT